MSLIERAVTRLGAGERDRGVGQTGRGGWDGPGADQGEGVRQGDRRRLDLRQLMESDVATVLADPKGRLAEEFRYIKRALLLNAFGPSAIGVGRRNVIMVTSAKPGEGKTFTALNLALSVAQERNRTALLIDADLGRPSVAERLGIPVAPGLTDCLKGERSIRDCILGTVDRRLAVLPAGSRVPHGTELLSSDGMRALVEELASRYPDRLVIFDSPPLLSASEAGALATWCGQVVLVVEAEGTRRQELEEARERIPGGRYVGLVLNKARLPFGVDRYYDAYDAYGYGHGD